LATPSKIYLMPKKKLLCDYLGEIIYFLNKTELQFICD
jgi:hypothetical protein